jgi:hypothetical protein
VEDFKMADQIFAFVQCSMKVEGIKTSFGHLLMFIKSIIIGKLFGLSIRNGVRRRFALGTAAVAPTLLIIWQIRFCF